MPFLSLTDFHGIVTKTRGEDTILEKLSSLNETSFSNMDCDASAVSVEGIDGSGDGPTGIAFEPLTTSKLVVVGLASSCDDQRHQSPSINDIDFAVRLGDDSAVRIYEHGSFKGRFGTYAAGSRF